MAGKGTRGSRLALDQDRGSCRPPAARRRRTARPPRQRCAASSRHRPRGALQHDVRTRASPNGSPSRVRGARRPRRRPAPDVARREVQRHGGRGARQRHRRERKAGRLVAHERRAPRGSADRALPAAVEAQPWVAGSSRPMNAVMKRSGQGLGELVVDLRCGLQVGAQAKRHAQHRVHLRHRQGRRDAVPGRVAQHDEQALVDQPRSKVSPPVRSAGRNVPYRS